MKIFAYIDRSRYVSGVWQHAVWVARQLNAPIEIIHVLDHTSARQNHDYSGYMSIDAFETAVEERVRIDEEHNRLQIEEGRRLLDTVAASIRNEGVENVSQRLFQGTVLEHLQQNSGDAILVVVGKRGEGGHRDPQHLGRNIERVVRSAHRPVLIANAEFSPVENAVIAWDAGKSSGEGIHFLANHPLLHNVDTMLVHVAERQGHAPSIIHDVANRLKNTARSVTIEERRGSASDEILDAVGEASAQLLVIGAYGHSRIRHLVIGSTTTEILMRSTTSVLVFH